LVLKIYRVVIKNEQVGNRLAAALLALIELSFISSKSRISLEFESSTNRDAVDEYILISPHA